MYKAQNTERREQSYGENKAAVKKRWESLEWNNQKERSGNKQLKEMAKERPNKEKCMENKGSERSWMEKIHTEKKRSRMHGSHRHKIKQGGAKDKGKRGQKQLWSWRQDGSESKEEMALKGEVGGEGREGKPPQPVPENSPANKSEIPGWRNPISFHRSQQDDDNLHQGGSDPNHTPSPTTNKIHCCFSSCFLSYSYSRGLSEFGGLQQRKWALGHGAGEE